LPSLGFAREVVVVVDTASRDDTHAVAEASGARVFTRALTGFGEQRAFALAQCHEPWVLWLDADERLAPGAAEVLAVAMGTEGVSGFWLGRRSWFLGRPIRFCGWQGERVLRLFRRSEARFDPAPVHEHVHVQGTVRMLPTSLEHYSYRNWESCRSKLFHYAAAGAEAARQRGRRATALDVVLRPPLRFLRMYVLQLGFLDGAHGAMLCCLAAAQVFLKYADLWAGNRRHDAQGAARGTTR
jgi:glycosyltransferase involved in cell wall biosynthesis